MMLSKFQKMIDAVEKVNSSLADVNDGLNVCFSFCTIGDSASVYFMDVQIWCSEQHGFPDCPETFFIEKLDMLYDIIKDSLIRLLCGQCRKRVDM